MVPAHSHKVPRASCYSGFCRSLQDSCTGFSPSLTSFPKTVPLPYGSLMQSEPRNARAPVWALSLSLAATQKIDFSFSSSGYLDVSVHRVPFHTLCIGVWMTGVFPAGFPHSEICGSNGYLLLPAAYRSLSRLSSALSAKASALRSFLIDLAMSTYRPYFGLLRAMHADYLVRSFRT